LPGKLSMRRLADRGMFLGKQLVWSDESDEPRPPC
jgi:hypothetical protein